MTSKGAVVLVVGGCGEGMDVIEAGDAAGAMDDEDPLSDMPSSDPHPLLLLLSMSLLLLPLSLDRKSRSSSLHRFSIVPTSEPVRMDSKRSAANREQF